MAEIDKMQLTADNIAIDPDLQNAPRQTASGLFIGQRTDKGKAVHAIPKSGYVRAVGPEVPDEIKVGMRVIISIDKPVGFRLNREEGYLIVKPDQVIAEVLTDEHIS